MTYQLPLLGSAYPALSHPSYPFLNQLLLASYLGQPLDLLPRSPLLIFLLVAASDGKVDKKELANFQKVVLGSGKLPSPLLQKAIADMLPNLERYLAELTSGKFDYIGELKRIGEYVDTNHPAEAQTFKMSLLGLGKLIAESSGGFFGFGNKMSKNEEQALVAIAVTLGVYPKP